MAMNGDLLSLSGVDRCRCVQIAGREAGEALHQQPLPGHRPGRKWHLERCNANQNAKTPTLPSFSLAQAAKLRNKLREPYRVRSFKRHL